ncbi:MAG: hypothetical protein ACHQZR_06460, partial [Candidatus Limnocylindrales bacterium]
MGRRPAGPQGRARAIRLLGGVAGLLALLEAVPAVAAAHSITGRFPSPLPLGAYLAGAAVAVALSFSLVLSRQPVVVPSGVGRSRRVPTALRAVLRLVGLAGWAAVLLQTALVAQPGDADVGSLFLWVYGWVGLAVLSALVGPVWAWLDPFDGLARLAGVAVRRLGLEGPRPAAYPTRLGHWPALAAYAYFIWLELAVTNGGGGVYLGLSLAGYTLVTMAGMLVYGRATWRRQAEAFTVWFGLLGRLAPRVLADDPDVGAAEDVEPTAAAVDEDPPVGLLGPGHVWTRRYASGLIHARWLVSEVALVAMAIAGVIFDGLSQTKPW